MRVCVCVCVCARARVSYAIYPYIHTLKKYINACTLCTYIYMYVYTHTYTYIQPSHRSCSVTPASKAHVPPVRRRRVFFYWLGKTDTRPQPRRVPKLRYFQCHQALHTQPSPSYYTPKQDQWDKKRRLRTNGVWQVGKTGTQQSPHQL